MIGIARIYYIILIYYNIYMQENIKRILLKYHDKKIIIDILIIIYRKYI